MPGEASNTPAPGGTPNAPGSEPTPQTWTPELEAASQQVGFSNGFGKGKDKGVKEALAQLGLGSDMESTLAALEELKGTSEPSKPAPVADSPQYQDLAAVNLKQATELDAANAQIATMEKRADEARLTKLRLAAKAKGVGDPQMDYFLKGHEDMFQLADDGQLVALSKMPDGTKVAAGKSVESYLDEVVADSPFLVATQGNGGAGTVIAPVSTPTERQAGDAPPGFDTRPLSERLKYGQ